MATLLEVEHGLEIGEAYRDQDDQAPEEGEEEAHEVIETPKAKTERPASKLPWCETHRVYNCGCRARKYFKRS